MTRLYRRLLAAPLFVGMSLAAYSYATDAPPDTQEWFRGQNQNLTPNRATNLAGQGGADFGGGPAVPPPPPQVPAHAHRNTPVSDFPDDQVHDWVVANARYAYSRAMFHRAEKELDNAVRAAQFTFEQSKEYQDAQAAEKQAYDAYATQRVKALQSVINDPKYVAALQLRDETGAKLKRLRAVTKGDLPHDVVMAMASLKLQYANDAHAMEAAALDNNSAVQDARKKMVEASSRVTALRTGFDASVRTNSQILQARRNLEDSRVALITAEAYLNGAALAGALATDYSYYRHRYDGLAGPALGYGNGYGYGYGY